MMRFRFVATTALLLSATAFPACLELETTNGGGGGAGGGPVSNDCSSAFLSCEVCEACAGQTPDGKCAIFYKACQDAPECLAIDTCVHTCKATDFTCFSNCWMMHPQGYAIYGQLYECMYCGECVTSCAMTVPCAG